jgi:hypothetical protein
LGNLTLIEGNFFYILEASQDINEFPYGVRDFQLCLGIQNWSEAKN